jgi:hypothetical protein
MCHTSGPRDGRDRKAPGIRRPILREAPLGQIGGVAANGNHFRPQGMETLQIGVELEQVRYAAIAGIAQVEHQEHRSMRELPVQTRGLAIMVLQREVRSGLVE